MEPITNREKSRARRQASHKRMWTLPLFAFSGVAFLLLAYLCQSAHVVRTQYKIVQVRGEIKDLQSERAELELQVQELTSLERVERVAVQKLGMISPQQRRVIEVVWSKAGENNQVAGSFHEKFNRQ